MRLGIPPPPWGGYDPGSMDGGRLRQVWLPPELAGEAEAGRSLGLVARGMAEVRFPVRVAGAGPVPGRVYAPAELLGVLRTGRQRPLGFDGDAFTVARAGYRGFRLYARTIDEVPALVERLRTEGVEVVARADDIRRIQVLDQGLARLFWLVASLGVAGGVAVLVASLYAAVQRKRRELAILRLIGLTRLDVFFFPIVPGDRCWRAWVWPWPWAPMWPWPRSSTALRRRARPRAADLCAATADPRCRHRGGAGAGHRQFYPGRLAGHPHRPGGGHP